MMRPTLSDLLRAVHVAGYDEKFHARPAFGMGVRLASVFTTTLLTANLLQNSETGFLTTPPLNLPLDNAAIFILWYLGLSSTGASTTGIAVRLRRGSGQAGTQLTTGTVYNCTAAAGLLMSGLMVDTPGIVAGQQYTLNLIQSGATGNGAAAEGAMIAFSL